MTEPTPKTNGENHPDLHGLLDASIEQIAQKWLDQLEAVKADASALQKQVLAGVADTKARLAAFHELGARATAHAASSREAIAQLADGVAQIAGGAA